VPDAHAIVYSVGFVPQLLSGEQDLSKRPIAVLMNENTAPLSQASRIFFGTDHLVQYNVKVKDLGMVHHDSLGDLQSLQCRYTGEGS
jgi:hypothetical protein